ncbi:MAG: M56 family metallopeptidase [Agathobacter sp.]|nr:M56 family metallopeptidase [Agathobacter sp.]
MMLKLLWNFESFRWFFDQCSAYFSIQLGRCVLFSFLALGLVLVLRHSILKEKIFLKGLLWSIFLLVPFVGKLELFYNNTLMCRLFLWWNNCCIEYPAIRYGYLLGVMISGALIFRQHRKLHRQINSMEQRIIDGKKVYISEMPVTPFTIGVLRSKIVVPKVMKDTFETEELQAVLLHERTHIRLGHLWFYLLWDILRMLLWLNPLLTYCMGYFKEDMEEICDRVTIRNGSSTSYEYGQVLLKSVKLLKAENMGMSAAFVGEKDYRDLKRRITKVADYKPYQKIGAVTLCSMGFLFLAGMFLLIRGISYPKYIEWADIGLVNEAGEYYNLAGSDTLEQAFRTDGQYVYIDRWAFGDVLRENGVDDDMDGFWLGFGTYTKLPGIGAVPNGIYVDYSGTESELVIPYVNGKDSLYDYIFKYIL